MGDQESQVQAGVHTGYTQGTQGSWSESPAAWAVRSADSEPLSSAVPGRAGCVESPHFRSAGRAGSTLLTQAHGPLVLWQARAACSESESRRLGPALPRRGPGGTPPGARAAEARNLGRAFQVRPRPRDHALNTRTLTARLGVYHSAHRQVRQCSAQHLRQSSIQGCT
jgi:hypothetical protein